MQIKNNDNNLSGYKICRVFGTKTVEQILQEILLTKLKDKH